MSHWISSQWRLPKSQKGSAQLDVDKIPLSRSLLWLLGILPLGLVLIGGVFAAYLRFNENLGVEVANERARIFIGEELALGIREVEINFYRMPTLQSRVSQDRIRKEIHARIDKLRHDLVVLEQGGAVQRLIQLNIEGVDDSMQQVAYTPNRSRHLYAIEMIELTPLFDQLAQMTDQLHALLVESDQFKNEAKTADLQRIERKLNLFFKQVPAVFIRVNENASRLLVDGQHQLDRFEDELAQEKRRYSLVGMGFGAAITLSVMLIAVFFARRIGASEKQLSLAWGAMRDAKDAAESASRAKSEFLASMSHELRTPLNAILGFAQLFEIDPALPEGVKVQAREIERAGQHLLSLVNDLIDLARIEAGKLELCPEPVQVKSVVADSLALVAPLARKQGIELIDTGDGREAMVFADYVRMRQVLINLLSNAIKYNSPQGSVRLSCRMGNSTVRICVADKGQGIPADKQARIFKAFDRLGKEAGMVEGTGIGLVITQRIVAAMGGKIGFESIEGQGSIFWVEFPASEASQAALPETAVSNGFPAPGSRQMARPLVLYIEDNTMNLRLMQQIFAVRKDLELHDAPSAELGIELAQAELPALVLMDINLPGMDGYEALARLRADPKTSHIPVVAISANAMKGDVERGLESGFAGYLTKPIHIPGLYAILDRLIEQKISAQGSNG